MLTDVPAFCFFLSYITLIFGILFGLDNSPSVNAKMAPAKFNVPNSTNQSSQGSTLVGPDPITTNFDSAQKPKLRRSNSETTTQPNSPTRYLKHMSATETESFPVPLDVPNRTRKARRRRGLKKSDQPIRRSERLKEKQARRLKETHAHEHTKLDTKPGIRFYMDQL
jgi:hypothetical protein